MMMGVWGALAAAGLVLEVGKHLAAQCDKEAGTGTRQVVIAHSE